MKTKNKPIIPGQRVLLSLAIVLTQAGMFPEQSRAANAGPPSRQTVKVLMFGDSVTAGGMPAAVEAALNERTKGRVTWACVNAGVGGETAEGGKTRVAALLDKERPDIVTVSYGLNDTWLKHGTERFVKNMGEIVSIIRAHAAAPKIVLLTTTPLDDRRHFLAKEQYYIDQGGPDRVLETQYNDATRQLAVRGKLPLIDVHKHFLSAKEPMKNILPDGVHLNADGYKLIGPFVAGPLAAWYGKEAKSKSAAAQARTPP